MDANGDTLKLIDFCMNNKKEQEYCSLEFKHQYVK